MGKIATIAAGLALVMSQAGSAAQVRAAEGAPVPAASDSASQASPDQAGQASPADAGAQTADSTQAGTGRHRISFRDPRVIAAALAGLAILTLGIIVATDHHKHHPASP